MQTQHRRRSIGALLLVILLIVTGGLSFVLPQQKTKAAVEQAKMADGPLGSFVDSIGIGTHLPYDGGPYGDFDGKVRPRLQELGIRHIRDGFGFDISGYFDKIRTLHNDGIGSTLLWGSWFNTPSIPDTVNYTAELADIVEVVEGPNEADLNHARFNYNGDGWDSDGNPAGQGWATGIRNYMADLYSALKADPRTSHLPVAMASLAWGGHADQLVGDPPFWNGDDHSDLGNGHFYTANYDPPGSALDSWHLHHIRKVNPTKPLIVTETGWTTATENSCGTCISEWAQSRYGLRAYLEHFSKGIQRSFMYELFDEGTNLANDQDMYGMIKNDGVTYKPLATGLKNMISLLSDPGPAFTPGYLDYTLNGGDSSVHHVLLQKRDGTFYLALWQDAKNYDSNGNIEVSPQNVELTLNTSIAQAQTFLPLMGTNVVDSFNNPTTLTLEVPDHPLFIELTPQTAQSFSTGLESGQPQPTWTNSVDTAGFPAGGISNVGGICCSLSAPETGTRSGETSHDGSTALMYSGYDNSNTSSYAYMKVFDTAIPISTSSTLSYWIYPQSNNTSPVSVGGNNSTCMAVDLIFTNGTSLRDSGLTDQTGDRAHPAFQCAHLTIDSWNQVLVNLGGLAGRTVDRIDLGYDQPGNTGGYRGYIDDISITG